MIWLVIIPGMETSPTTMSPFTIGMSDARSEHLGAHRWVMERTLAWLSRFRRLTIRYERRANIHQAFLTLACALICLRSV